MAMLNIPKNNGQVWSSRSREDIKNLDLACQIMVIDLFKNLFVSMFCLKPDMNPLIVMAIGDQLKKHFKIWPLKQITKYSIP